MNDIAERISGDFAWQWVLMFIMLLLLLWKFYPDIKGVFEKYRKHENSKEDLTGTVSRHETEIHEINDKLDRDYQAINEMRKSMNSQKDFIADSLEEREIIMRSMLAVLKGLQELGSNGPTKEAQKDIEDYMNRQAHEMKCE